MEVYIEDITEDYGTHGVSVYSLVHGMDGYVADVRASGVSIFESADYDNGQSPLDEGSEQYSILNKALVGYLAKEISNE